MTLDSRIDRARLTVLLDLRHPLAYLALHPTIAFGRAQGLEINWLPVRVPPLRAPTTPAPGDDRGIRHRRHRARAIAREIETYGAAQGLELRDFYRDVDPGAAFGAWLWMRENQHDQLEAFLGELFRAYWAHELDPADPLAVARMLDGFGRGCPDFPGWFAEIGQARVEALEAELNARGLTGTPLYQLDDEVFLGRQHLPMLEWILRGRSGPVPI